MWLALILFACGSGTPDVEAPPPPPPEPAPAPPEEKAEMPPASEKLHPHMEEHLAAVTSARNALLVGDHEAAKERLSWIAHHEPAEGMPREWAPHVEAMRNAAQLAARGKDVDVVAGGLAKVARSCGACHDALGKGPHFDVEPSRADGDTQHDHMIRHNEASEALWRGLVSADDAQWAHGARALAEQKALRGLKHPSGAPTPDGVKALGKRVHALGAAGLQEMDWDDRATVYGELVATCGGCHVEEKVGAE